MIKLLRDPMVGGIAFGLIVVGLLTFGLSSEQAEVVVAPTYCDALAHLGQSLRKLPTTGCVYTGPVHRGFTTYTLGDFILPRTAILAERPLPQGGRS